MNPPEIVKLKQLKTERGNDASDNRDDPDYLAKAVVVPDKELPPQVGRFRPKKLSEILSAPEPEWHIHDLMVSKGVGSLLAPSAAGKTFTALDLVAHLAAGKSWHGLDIPEPVGTVYVSGEGRLQPRLKALAAHSGIATEQEIENRVGFIEIAVNLLGNNQSSDVDQLINDIRLTAAEREIPIRLIVFDTLARMTPGSDESARDMGRALAACDAIRDALDCFVLLLYHTGWENKHRGRGSSLVFGNLDMEILIEYPSDADGETVRTLKATKIKDGEEFTIGGFRLRKVVLGLNRHGKPVSSCVVEPTTAQAAKPKAQKPIVPNKAGSTVLRCLHEVLTVLQKSNNAPTTGPSERDYGGLNGQTMAPVAMVRKRFDEVMKMQNAGAAEAGERQIKNVPSVWKKGTEDLYNKGLVQTNKEMMWLGQARHNP